MQWWTAILQRRGEIIMVTVQGKCLVYIVRNAPSTQRLVTKVAVQLRRTNRFPVQFETLHRLKELID